MLRPEDPPPAPFGGSSSALSTHRLYLHGELGQQVHVCPGVRCHVPPDRCKAICMWACLYLDQISKHNRDFPAWATRVHSSESRTRDPSNRGDTVLGTRFSLF